MIRITAEMDLRAYKKELRKKELRKEKIAAREALSETDRISYSSKICERIAGTPEYAAAKTVLLYKWVRGEVRLDELEKQAASDAKRLAYPLCVNKSEMLAIEPGAGDDAWEDSGFIGISEPVMEKGTLIDPCEIDLIIAPCSSFDENCRRLGMGMGYYDRFLPGCINAAVIAAAFEAQRSEEIPVDEYDHSADAVVTENRLIRR